MQDFNDYSKEQWRNNLYRRIMLIASELNELKLEINSLRDVQKKYNENPLIDYQIEKIYDELKKTDVFEPVRALYENREVVIYPCDPKYCTGCMACVDACKTGAIRKIQDDEGFYKIKIDSQKCVDCGNCISKCHNNCDTQILLREPMEVFASKSKDEEKRLSSSSGGIFIELAEEVFEDDGVVFGAGFDDCLMVKHIDIKKGEIGRIIGSKYVQSDSLNIYSKIKKYLDKGKKVLFSGTPCQVAAVRDYIGYDKNLYTIDLVCHGTPSPLVFEEYKKQLEQQYGKIKEINFRSKQNGWKKYCMEILFESGEKYIKNNTEDIFYKGFLQEYTNNMVCHRCRYANSKRVGDISLCDLWGYESTELLVDDDKGISGIMINSTKGQELFDSIKDRIDYIEYDYNKIKISNRCLNLPSKVNPYRKEFWECFRKRGFMQAGMQYFK